MKLKHIVISGNIGVGKTTLAEKLAKKYIKNIKSGGDGNRSRFVLVPLAELFLKKNIG